MPAAYDNSVQANSTAGVANITSGAFTLGGVNRCAYVMALCADAGVSDATEVRMDNSAGTLFTKQGASLSISTVMKLSLWRLIAPASGSHPIFMKAAAANAVMALIAVNYQDCDQTNPNGTIVTASGTNATPSANVPSAVGQLVADFLGWLDTAASGRTITVGSGQTSRQEIEGATLLSEAGAASSTEVATTTSTTMDWTMSGAPSDGWATFAFALNGISATGSGPAPKTIWVMP